MRIGLIWWVGGRVQSHPKQPYKKFERAKTKVPKTHVVSPGDPSRGVDVETGVAFGREGGSASGRETLAIKRSGRASSEGRRIAVGSSWSLKPPRGGSTVEGTPVRKERSRARMPNAKRSVEWGWAVSAPSTA